MTEEERRQMAQQATSTLGRNLAVGGFGNPMTYTPPERPSPFAGTAEQFARMPEQAAAPSNLFGSMVAPKFPENYSQQLGRRQTMDLGSTPPLAPVTDTISSFGNPMASRTERITSQYGTASTTLTPEQQAERFRTTQQAQQMGTMPRTSEQQQALLAQMREAGAGIRQRIAEQNIRPTQEATNRYYAFRQGLEERRAQEALSTERGRSPDVMRGAQASVEAERWKQAQAGRSPMSREPISAFGFQFQRGSMGQYSPARTIGTASGMVPSGGPQPASAMQTTPQAGGFMASGIMPSFTSAGIQPQERDEWLRRNFPQDYFTTPSGGQGMRMIARSTPLDQIMYF